jgi:D-tyrosyl-tRNA(Tyr) deacylase
VLVRAVVQRVSEAAVVVDGRVVGAVGPGLLVLIGVGHDDTDDDAEALAAKVAGLRVFTDDEGKMNRSVAETGGGVLVVSQFTLLGDVRRGRRPSFSAAAVPDRAEPLVGRVAVALQEAGIPTATGRFGARMEVRLVNDGPVTLVIDVSGGRVQ